MRFYLTKTTTNEEQHLVHTEHCDYLPIEKLRIDLGEYYSCEAALKEAKKQEEKSNGCFHCALLCHESSK